MNQTFVLSFVMHSLIVVEHLKFLVHSLHHVLILLSLHHVLILLA